MGELEKPGERQGAAGPVAAIILAAGKGTRMRSERAKVLAPLMGRPMLSRVIEAIRQAGCDRIVAVVGYDRDAVIAALPPGVRWVEQPDQRGTGDAVRRAEPELGSFGGWILILPGDVPFVRPETLRRLIDAAREGGGEAPGALLSCRVGPESTFGRIVRDGTGRAARVVEHRDASEEERRISEGNAGIYCFRPAELFRALREVGNENAQREFYLTDVVEILARGGRAPVVVPVGDEEEARSVDTPESLAAAEERLGRREGPAAGSDAGPAEGLGDPKIRR